MRTVDDRTFLIWVYERLMLLEKENSNGREVNQLADYYHTLRAIIYNTPAADCEKVGRWLGMTVYTKPQALVDVLVLRKVRSLEFAERQGFIKRFCFATANSLLGQVWVDGYEYPTALLLAYEPGMYVEAARFLWEKS